MLIKSHCKRGHILSPENVAVYNGSRHCKLCARIRTKNWSLRQDVMERLPLEERIHASCSRLANGCWEWQLSPSSAKYPTTEVKGKTQSVRRIVYEMYVGSIPNNHKITITCSTAACINPEHLEAISCQERTRRSMSPCGKNAEKEVCSKGHPLEGDNLHIEPSGSRRCRTCRADFVRKCKYGITSEDYAKKITQQNNKCAICRRTETMLDRWGKVRSLVVDHDHITGNIRGLLCGRCNSLIGFIDENIDTAIAVVEYLKEWKV